MMSGGNATLAALTHSIAFIGLAGRIQSSYLTCPLCRLVLQKTNHILPQIQICPHGDVTSEDVGATILTQSLFQTMARQLQQ
jgi:hypothetical protein